MATLRQYFETDFNHVVRIHVSFAVPGSEEIEALWLVDFLGYMSFLSCYVPGMGRSLDYYMDVIRALEYGKTTLTLGHAIGLPSARQFHGSLRVEKIMKIWVFMPSSLGTHAGFRLGMSRCPNAYLSIPRPSWLILT